MSVSFCRTAPSGNVFWILASAQQVLKRQGRRAESDQMASRVYQCESYEEALEIMSEYVELEEVEEDA